MSARDKFLAANAANKQQRGNTSTQDTIFGDFVKRTESTESDVATEKIKEVETNTDTKKNSEPVMNNMAEETHTINKESAIYKVTQSKKDSSGSGEEKARICVRLTEEQSDTLYMSATSQGVSMTRIISDMILEDARQISDPGDALAKQFRGRLHCGKVVYFSVDASLKNMIAEKAKQYYMTPMAYTTYVINKMLG